MGRRYTIQDLEKQGLVETSPGIFQSINKGIKPAFTKTPRQKAFPAKEIKQRIDELTSLGIHSSPLIVFNVNPMGKPRMTQRDKWLKPPRKPVALYWAFKEVLNSTAKSAGFVMPESDYHIFAIIQMPHSWPEKKKNLMDGTPHQQKPDKDNIEKGILDALLGDDSKVWDGRMTKRWGISGRIIIYPINKLA